MTSEGLNPDFPRRKALRVAVSAICADLGFGSADEGCLETLTEMLQSFITEAGRSSRAYSELSGRTHPMLSDVILSLAEMGFDVESLPAYAKKSTKYMILPPGIAAPTPQPHSLQVGQKSSHPSHIPEYLPEFPDPHTFTKTLTHKPPISEYQVVREKAASQKRDVERALTRFIAKTGETESLFQDDPYAFPLIAHKPRPLPYLEALSSKDRDLTAEEDDDKSTQTQNQAMKKEAVPPPQDPADLNTSQESQTSKHSLDGTTSNDPEAENQIDNPYLRTIKMPKLKGGKKHKW